MTYQIILKKSGTVMLMENSELQKLSETVFNDILPLKDPQTVNKLEPMFTGYIKLYKDAKEAKDQIASLLDKCYDFNVLSQKWSKPPKAGFSVDAQDRLKQAIDMHVDRLETWLPKNWTDLVMELRYEMKVAYEKFLALRKKYFGLITANQGNQGSELIKAYITRDIQDYVKYGINISLRVFDYQSTSTKWVRKIAIHFELLSRELEGLNVQKENDVRRLADDVSLYKQCMLDFGDNCESGLNESNSKAYVMLRQKGGIPFSNLIKRKKNELEFEGEFDHLKASKQRKVYQAIINEFGGQNTSEVEFVDFLFGKGSQLTTYIEELSNKYLAFQMNTLLKTIYGE